MNSLKQEVYIVGGGTSLIGKDLKKLENKNTIVINKSLLFVPNPTYYVTLDYTSLKKVPVAGQKVNKIFVANMKSLKEQNGALFDPSCKLIYTQLHSVFDMVLLAKKEEGLGSTWFDFRSGNHSGYAAIQFALLMGYKTIYLLGYDYCTQNNKTHFHNAYGHPANHYDKTLKTFCAALITGLRELTKFPHVGIISCSEISLLNDVLLYKPLEEVL